MAARLAQGSARGSPYSDLMPENIADIANIDIGSGLVPPPIPSSQGAFRAKFNSRSSVSCSEGEPGINCGPTFLPNARQNISRSSMGYPIYGTARLDGGTVKLIRFTA